MDKVPTYGLWDYCFGETFLFAFEPLFNGNILTLQAIQLEKKGS
jgi:hypothetical protein